VQLQQSLLSRNPWQQQQQDMPLWRQLLVAACLHKAGLPALDEAAAAALPVTELPTRHPPAAAATGPSSTSASALAGGCNNSCPKASAPAVTEAAVAATVNWSSCTPSAAVAAAATRAEPMPHCQTDPASIAPWLSCSTAAVKPELPEPINAAASCPSAALTTAVPFGEQLNSLPYQQPTRLPGQQQQPQQQQQVPMTPPAVQSAIQQVLNLSSILHGSLSVPGVLQAAPLPAWAQSAQLEVAQLALRLPDSCDITAIMADVLTAHEQVGASLGTHGLLRQSCALWRWL
jgi:hypothetical protein